MKISKWSAAVIVLLIIGLGSALVYKMMDEKEPIQTAEKKVEKRMPPPPSYQAKGKDIIIQSSTIYRADLETTLNELKRQKEDLPKVTKEAIEKFEAEQELKNKKLEEEIARREAILAL